MGSMEAARRAGIMAAIKPESREQSTDGQDCNRVVPPDTKEKCLNGARGEPRDNEPGDETQGKQGRGLLEHKQQYVGSLRAESHADADFARAAADGIGHEAIKTDQCEKQRNGREDSEQRGLKAPPRTGLRLQFAHGLNVGGGETGVEGAKDGANGGCEGFCRKRGADGDVSTSELHVGMIDLRRGGFFQAGEAHVANDTDNSAPSSVVILPADAATDGVATGKILSGETLIDDDGMRPGFLVSGEQPPGDKRNSHRSKIIGRRPARFSQLTFLVWIAIHREHA